MELRNRRVLVIGMARSGISAAIFTKKQGAHVTVYDSKNETVLEESIKELKKYEIAIQCGKKNIDNLLDFELMILSPGVPTDLSFIKEAKQVNIPVIGEVELAYQFCKSDIIGITGTNGKTTTTSLVGQIVTSYDSGSQIVGNIGIPFTSQLDKLDQGHFAVAELSSFQLETIKDFRCRVSAVLNISPDHLNRHKTLENYIEAKKNVFRNQSNEDICVLNYNDLECRKMAKESPAKVIFFSYEMELNEGVYFKDNHIMLSTGEMKTEVCRVEDLNILGRHSVENAMAAVAICFYAGIPINHIREQLIQFEAVEHRIEYVSTINGVRYYNDSKATNPDAAIKGLDAMQWPTVLIGGGMDKDSDFTDWVNGFEGKVKQLIVFGETADQIISTAKKIDFSKVIKVHNLEEAVSKAYMYADKGDCVLLSPACASWDMFNSFEERGDLFKKLVLDLKG
ncbi:UDP-N-acetylmuramoyl-L-alanine--D-glutamate ligase [Vallitalea okinawensis]|uniref:UDP-N-acetylmuramoyl-L-alanine--D-glutamate ligase n=1 Tax=Vallitalea okinawensis TaxID=2078660 RepID=UPI000CFDB344|nr:UDP-N-acetylmuramoyl-L-alanine--D-glutamate ligase [Vallitalea okinawensis]